MPKNLVYDLTETEKAEVAEKVRGSNLVWDAVEVYVRRRLDGADPEKALSDLNSVLELEADYYVNDWRAEKPEEEGLDGPWEAA